MNCKDCSLKETYSGPAIENCPGPVTTGMPGDEEGSERCPEQLQLMQGGQ